ncbi:hypothetical protein L3Q82_008956 [Scortum barcoo]|uniref:Uncharacterized protein n=1 Tax=Scortum barcoo TaxID=214431 RepID=A0ACB8XDM2_9TELE|nr:hypothetical protein L3Q82_008956 [Scortum barcoo]
MCVDMREPNKAVAGLKLNTERCLFRHTTLDFLGYRISPQGLEPNDSHVKAILDAPSPVDAASLRSFLGLCAWYSKFMPNHDSVVKPMRALLRKNSAFTWNNAAQASFAQVKGIIANGPALKLFDLNKSTVISTDASDYGLGAILTQVNNAGEEETVAFASRSLSDAERKYSIVEKEALACIWAAEKLQSLQKRLLDIAHETHQGIARTKQRLRELYWWPGMDSQVEALVKECSTCRQNDKSAVTHNAPLYPVPLPVAPWGKVGIDIVGPFDNAPREPGSINIGPDALSWQFTMEETAQETNNILPSSQIIVVLTWDIEATVQRAQQTDLGGGPPGHLFIPDAIHSEWPTLDQDDQDFVLSCTTCARDKSIYMSAANPSSWKSYLPWIEYSHNFLVSSATGLSPFKASLAYHPLLFSHHKLSVPSVQHHLQCCQVMWQRTQVALEVTRRRNQRAADKHQSPASQYTKGQSVWLSSKNIPLRSESCKLSSHYFGPFAIQEMINPSAVHLKLPSSMQIHHQPSMWLFRWSCRRSSISRC